MRDGIAYNVMVLQPIDVFITFNSRLFLYLFIKLFKWVKNLKLWIKIFWGIVYFHNIC